MWADFLKMSLTNPVPHVLLTVCWTHLHGVGVIMPPTPAMNLHESFWWHQTVKPDGGDAVNLQGWVIKRSDFCLSPSFGTLALSSQAPCWEEPSRYHAVGPPWRTCNQCQLPDVWVNALSEILDLRLHGIDSHHPFCALSKFLMHQIHEHNKWLFYITKFGGHFLVAIVSTVQFSSVSQSCPTLCDPMNRSTPGLPVHHQLPECTQTHVHWVSDAIQPSHPLSSPSPPAPNPSQHQGLSNESTLRMRWPKYWSFSFSIIPSKEHPGLIFRMQNLL